MSLVRLLIPFVPAEAGTQTLSRESAWLLGPRFRGDQIKVYYNPQNPQEISTLVLLQGRRATFGKR